MTDQQVKSDQSTGVLKALNDGSGGVYCASHAAIRAATIAYRESTGDYADPKGLAAALVAAHHARLGLDRSVCLRDLVAAGVAL